MSISKTQKITQADLLVIITSVNTELGRRELDTIVPPAQYDVVDDIQLDTLAIKIRTIEASHCNCQTNTGRVHGGCPAYVSRVLGSAQVDEGVPIIASESALPDVLDIQTDLAKLTTQLACNPQCSCVHDCSCNGVSNITCTCESQCGCQTECECQGECGCDNDCHTDTPCHCDNVCSCDGVCDCVKTYSTCDCKKNTCSCEGYHYCECNFYTV